MAESVIATIEVKSTLTKAKLETAVKSARDVKNLQRSLATHISQIGQVAQGIVCFVVAYKCASSAKTILNWLVEIDRRLGINLEPLPERGDQRAKKLSGGVEGVFVLGRSSIVFDYDAVGVIDDKNRRFYPNAKYQYWDAPSGHLFWFFLLLTQSISMVQGQWPHLDPYFANQSFKNVRFGPDGT